MTFIGARTSRLRLVSSVMTFRTGTRRDSQNPRNDRADGRQVTVGVGVGWMREEFEALAAPDFAARGRQQRIPEIFKKLWTEDRPSHAGTHYQFDGLCLKTRSEPTSADSIEGTRAWLAVCGTLRGWLVSGGLNCGLAATAL